MTLNMGYLYPFFVQEVLPGDRFRVACQIFLRFLSLISPVMHRVDVYTHFFSFLTDLYGLTGIASLLVVKVVLAVL